MNGSKPFSPSGHPFALATMGTHSAVGSSVFPSPRPSPRGEGERCPAIGRVRAHRIYQVAVEVSPSPRGEGRGEGKQGDLRLDG